MAEKITRIDESGATKKELCHAADIDGDTFDDIADAAGVPVAQDERGPLTIAEMPLRDFFAAQVVGHLAAQENTDRDIDDDCIMAYSYADAMLLARKSPIKEQGS